MIRQEIIAFIIDRQARGLSENTIDFYQSELSQFADFLDQHSVKTIDKISPMVIRMFLIELGERRNKGGVHAAFRSIKAWLNWYAIECDDPTWRNPIRKVKLPEPSKEPLPGVPTVHIKAMLATCSRDYLDQRDKAILICLLDTGLRRNEFLNLNLGDVDLQTGALQVHHGKGDKDRTVYLGVRARRELIRYLRHRGQLHETEPLWVTKMNTRLKPAGLRQLLRRRAEKAGVPNPQIHDFRRTFAIESLRNNVDEISLMHLMGHSSTSELRRYLKLVESDLRRAHEKGSPADNLK